MKKSLIIVLTLIAVFSFASEARYPSLNGVTKAETQKIMSYLPDGEYYPVPNYKNRSFWAKYPVSKYVRGSVQDRMKKPMPEYGVELWKVARTIRYGDNPPDPVGRKATEKWEYSNIELGRIFSACVTMECIENQGRYIPQIVKALDCLMSSPLGWPGHDRHNLVLTKNMRYACMGGMIRTGYLATIYYVLDDKLPEATRKKIREYLNEWVFHPVNRALALPPGGKPSSLINGSWSMDWLAQNYNMTPFCYSQLLLAAFALPRPKEERAWYIANALAACKTYLDYYTKAGYTREGFSYWLTGFDPWLDMASFLQGATCGKIDLSKDPKAANIAAMGYKIVMADVGLYPEFGDNGGNGGRAQPFTVMSYIKLNNFSGVNYYARELEGREFVTMGGVHITGDMLNSAMAMKGTKNLKPAPERPLYFYDPEAQIMVSRDYPNAKLPFSFAIKGGANFGPHHHIDVGTFLIGLGSRIHCGDLGSPVYKSTTRAFVNSSAMHPVPVVNGKLQSNGKKEYSAKVLKFSADNKKSGIKLDIRNAYVEPKLKKLIREAEHDRKDREITIEDSFEFTEPCDFGGNLLSFLPVRQLSGNVWTMGNLKIEFKADGGTLTFKNETMNVEMHCKDKVQRLSYQFSSKVKKGEIVIKISPVK